MKKVISFLTGFLILVQAYGQGWERLLPLGDAFSSFSNGRLIPTADGGFLISSSTYEYAAPQDSSYLLHQLYKLGADGLVQWQQPHTALFSAQVMSMYPVESGKLLFVTLDTASDVSQLVKTDANFQILWAQTLDAPEHSGYRTNIRRVGNAYAVIYQRNGQQSEPVRIIKTDLDGTTLWQDDYTVVANFTFRDVVADKQGNLFLFGEGGTPFGARAGKISPSGTLLFTQGYGPNGIGHSPIVLNDNLLAFLDFNTHLRLIDADGQLVNTLTVSNSTYRIAATADGNILLADSDNISTLEKITPTGIVLWSTNFNNVNAAYSKAPFDLWSLPDGGSVTFFIPSNGSRPYYIVRTDANGQVYTNQLSGNIFADTDDDCVHTPGVDFPAPAVTIVAQEGESFYYATTDTLGNYTLTLDTGTYLLRILPPGGVWDRCTDSLTLTFGAYDTLSWDNGISSVLACPWPGVDLSAAFLRRCFPSQYHVAYGNSSEVAADSAVVTLTLDPALALQSASLPFVDLGSNVYRFPLGDLAPLQTGSFTVVVVVNCDPELMGATHCSTAEIEIANPCAFTPIEFPIIEVKAVCEGDSVAFNIKNIGGAPMLTPAEFVVIEDLIVMRQGQFQLTAQQSEVVKCPANGATSRMYAGQAPGEPPFFATTTAIEGCNGPIQPGFWQMFPEILADQQVDRDCQPNIGAFDPNDKQAIPAGYDTEHWLPRNVPLDYKIRFQNTGTDTAFTVVIRDTLSAFLNAASIRPGAASHPYSWQLTGDGIVEFRFEHILLPDSNVNLAGSHGFVEFRIQQQPDLPLETLIENDAAIYFDFNAPVITNTTFHRIGEDFLPVVVTWEPAQPGVLLRLAPNPVGQSARLTLPDWTEAGDLQLQLFDLQGHLVREIAGDATGFDWQSDRLAAGLYLFSIWQNGVLLGRGKLVL